MPLPRKNPLTVSDLKRYLARTRLTPELFAKEVGLGNMTIRRWLKKEDHEAIPPKYFPLLGPRFGKTLELELPKSSLPRALKDFSMDTLMKELESSGRNFVEFKSLETAVKNTLKRVSPDKTFLRCCSELLKVAKSSKTKPYAKAIAVGALLYFVDPIGMPEDTPLISYLSELAVLSVALNVAHEAA